MSADEARAYQEDPLLEQYIRLRRWDDLAKRTDLRVDPADLESLRKRMIRYLGSLKPANIDSSHRI